MLHTGLLLWARGAPLFVLGPWISLGVLPGLLSLLLSVVFAGVLLPWAAVAFAGGVELGTPLWIAGCVELARGCVVAIGCSLPFAALRTAGGAAESLAGPTHAAAMSGRLARLCGLAGLASVIGAGGLAGVLRFLLGRESLPVLGGEPASLETARALCWELAQLGVRAFTLGVSLSAPLLLGAAIAALVFGVLGRLLGERESRPLGASGALWLVLFGLAVALTHWLAALPELVRAFARRAARLLAGLP
ncbi:MAG: flagellar biosynthetic protein FliR [Polyangiales bacterium]